MSNQITSSIAKTDDGTIQITFTIPEHLVKNAQEKVIDETGKTITVPGFRKGMAPADKVRERLGETFLSEQTLSQILPEAYTKALVENKIRPITYPKFEILNQKDNWEVRATVAEFPEIELGEYRKVIEGNLRSEALKKELGKEEKEQITIKSLLETVKVNLPKVLIEDEVNARLSQLLARIEKLGLNFDGYLQSIGKTAPDLRHEYEHQVKDGVTIELTLNKIAEVEKIEAPAKDLEEATKISPASGKEPTDEEKLYIKSVLTRRAVLDQLVALI